MVCFPWYLPWETELVLCCCEAVSNSNRCLFNSVQFEDSGHLVRSLYETAGEIWVPKHVSYSLSKAKQTLRVFAISFTWAFNQKYLRCTLKILYVKKGLMLKACIGLKTCCWSKIIWQGIPQRWSCMFKCILTLSSRLAGTAIYLHTENIFNFSSD